MGGGGGSIRAAGLAPGETRLEYVALQIPTNPPQEEKTANVLSNSNIGNKQVDIQRFAGDITLQRRPSS